MSPESAITRWRNFSANRKFTKEIHAISQREGAFFLPISPIARSGPHSARLGRGPFLRQGFPRLLKGGRRDELTRRWSINPMVNRDGLGHYREQVVAPPRRHSRRWYQIITRSIIDMRPVSTLSIVFVHQHSLRCSARVAAHISWRLNTIQS
jgi:hypothetical protein